MVDSEAQMWKKVFKRNKDVVSRRIADEFFLVPVKGNLADMQRIFALNPVAEFIWQELGKRSLADIRDDILINFSVEKQQADSDVLDFIEELLGAELIEELI